MFNEESEIRRILTDERLHGIKAILEKDHAIDCIFLLLLNKGRWKDAKAFMNSLGLSISDGSFRARMRELELKGFAKSTHLDTLKKMWTPTEMGEKFGKLLLEVFRKL